MLTFISILSMLTNMAIQLVIAAQLGAGAERDSLFVAMSVPLLVNTLLVSTIGVIITPVIVSHRSLIAQHNLIRRVIRWLIFGSVTVAIGIYLGRGFFVRMLAPGFGISDQARTAQLLALAVIMLPIQAVATVLGGFLIAKERVLLPTASQLSGNAITLGLALLAGASFTASDAILATLAGAISTLLMQSSVLWGRRALASSDEVENLKGSAVSIFYKQAAPLLISGVVSRSIPLVERNLASSMGVGTISCLGYAGYLVSFLVNATTAPTATASFAQMCGLWNDGKREEVGAILEKNLRGVLALALSASGLFIFLAPELAWIVPRFSRFSVADAQEFVDYGRILMIAYCLLSCGGLLSRMFYVTGASMRMAILDCFSTAFYAVVAWCLARSFGGYGLAVAVSLHSAIVTGLFVHWARSQFVTHLRRRFYGGVFSIILTWALVLCISLVGQRALATVASTEVATGIPLIVYLVGAGWIIVRQRTLRA